MRLSARDDGIFSVNFLRFLRCTCRLCFSMLFVSATSVKIQNIVFGSLPDYFDSNDRYKKKKKDIGTFCSFTSN